MVVVEVMKVTVVVFVVLLVVVLVTEVFYLKEPVNNNDSPFYHIQVHFMRGVLCWKPRIFPD